MKYNLVGIVVALTGALFLTLGQLFAGSLFVLIWYGIAVGVGFFTVFALKD